MGSTEINQAYRYELDPNDRQRTLLAKHSGTARYAYNWALALCKERLGLKEAGAARSGAASPLEVPDPPDLDRLA
jgi:putative transposase